MKGYAVRYVIIDGHRAAIYMHESIMEEELGRPLEENEQVEHINGDTLDNRRKNLKLVKEDEDGLLRF